MKVNFLKIWPPTLFHAFLRFYFWQRISIKFQNKEGKPIPIISFRVGRKWSWFRRNTRAHRWTAASNYWNISRLIKNSSYLKFITWTMLLFSAGDRGSRCFCRILCGMSVLFQTTQAAILRRAWRWCLRLKNDQMCWYMIFRTSFVSFHNIKFVRNLTWLKISIVNFRDL